MHARTVLGERKSVLIREVSSFQGCPQRVVSVFTLVVMQIIALKDLVYSFAAPGEYVFREIDVDIIRVVLFLLDGLCCIA